jgi:hypothetical protein
MKSVLRWLSIALSWGFVAISSGAVFLPLIIGAWGIYVLIFRSALLGLVMIGAAVVLRYVLGLIVIGLMLAMAALSSIADRQ